MHVHNMCEDTNFDQWGYMTADKDEDGCDEYTNNPNWCGGDYADSDFDPMTMCCVCGGG